VTLSSGSKLGPYEILAPLGAGGMGEVYRARDPRLDREVAIKVLPEAFSQDPARLARFDREARALAALNHPGIAAIHGIEEADSGRFLVLELVQGETLAARLSRGPLPVEEALSVCRQIAEALEVAHEKGLIHRDLKPGNVMVTPDEKVKLLDFGLAKGIEGKPSDSDPESPTLPKPPTAEGVILGTAAYMSPEQARGKPLDKRTDIWSFGGVLYEAMTGRRAFGGESVSDSLAAVLDREPDWEALPPETPTTVRSLLKRCLRKDRGKRLHDIADAQIEIEEALAGLSTTAPVSVPAARRGWRSWRVASLLMVVTALAIAFGTWHLLWTGPARLPRMLMVVPPPNAVLAKASGTDVAISPDGQWIVYVGVVAGTTQLFIRPLDTFDVQPLDGTEGGRMPFFSPEGRWLGYYSDAEHKLMKLRLTSAPSAPIQVCDATAVFSASWHASGTIVLGSATRGHGVSRVPAAGGSPQQLTRPDNTNGEIAHDSPVLLPNGRTLLFVIRREGGHDQNLIVAEDLEKGERKILARGGTNVQYLPTGHLLCNRMGTLLAATFDPAALDVGEWIPVADGLRFGTTHAAEFSCSRDGTLTYVHGPTTTRASFVWVDTEAGETPMTEGPDPLGVGSGGTYTPRGFSLSPDGRRVAVVRWQDARRQNDIWIYDLARNTQEQLTFEGHNRSPAWAFDGDRLAFVSERSGTVGIYWTRADEPVRSGPLWTSEHGLAVHSWSPDGNLLAFVETHPLTGADIWLFSFADGTATPYLSTSARESSPCFAPDGRWMAYASDQSGQDEVYVQSLSGVSITRPVSTDGGTDPRWAPGGKELLYRTGNRLTAVSVSMEPTFRKVGQPRLVFEGDRIVGYDIHPEDGRFLVAKGERERAGLMEIRVILNWFEELKRRVPTG